MSGLPHQTFVTLIGTCGMDNDPLCCEGIFPMPVGAKGNHLLIDICIGISYDKWSLTPTRVEAFEKRLETT